MLTTWRVICVHFFFFFIFKPPHTCTNHHDKRGSTLERSPTTGERVRVSRTTSTSTTIRSSADPPCHGEKDARTGTHQHPRRCVLCAWMSTGKRADRFGQHYDVLSNLLRHSRLCCTACISLVSYQVSVKGLPCQGKQLLVGSITLLNRTSGCIHIYG